jgi:hypothetical protein
MLLKAGSRMSLQNAKIKASGSRMDFPYETPNQKRLEEESEKEFMDRIDLELKEKTLHDMAEIERNRLSNRESFETLDYSIDIAEGCYLSAMDHSQEIGHTNLGEKLVRIGQKFDSLVNRTKKKMEKLKPEQRTRYRFHGKATIFA